MSHPEILIIPLAAFADFYLTLVSAKYYHGKYSEFVRLEQFELNPRLQSTLNRRKWFNPRHHFTVLLVTGCLLVLGWTGQPEYGRDIFIAFVSGFLTLSLLTLVGRHVCNILTFRHVMKDPQGVVGHVSFDYRTSVRFSTYQVLLVLIPVAPFLVASHSAFAYGGLAGLLALFWVHRFWLKAYRKGSEQRADG